MQPGQVVGGDAGSGHVKAGFRWPQVRVQGNSGYQALAGGGSALIVLLVETDVRAKLQLVRAPHPAQVIDQLRRIQPADGVRLIDVGDVDVSEGIRGQTCGGGVGIDVREIELEAGITGCEFIDHGGGDGVAPREREVHGRPVNFATRCVAGENRGAAVKRVALQLVLFGPQGAEEDVVLFIYEVVDANQVTRSTDLVGSVPEESGYVQAIAGGVVVGSGISFEEFEHAGIAANFARVIGEHIVGLHAIGIAGAAAVAHAGRERTIGTNQIGGILRNTRAVDGLRIGRVGYPVAVVAGQSLRRVHVGNFSEGLIDGEREVHFLSLPCAIEEGLVLSDGAAHIETILVGIQLGTGLTLRVGIEFGGIEDLVAEVLDQREVKFIGAGAGSDGNVEAGVLAFFRGGIRGRDLEFFHVVRVDAENVVGGHRVGGLVGFNTIDSHVARHGTGSVHHDRGAGALRNTRFEHDQVQRVAAIEGQRGDGGALNHVAERG